MKQRKVNRGKAKLRRERGRRSRETRTAEAELHEGGQGGPEQKAGGPEHHGGDEHEDRNP